MFCSFVHVNTNIKLIFHVFQDYFTQQITLNFDIWKIISKSFIFKTLTSTEMNSLTPKTYFLIPRMIRYDNLNQSYITLKIYDGHFGFLSCDTVVNDEICTISINITHFTSKSVSSSLMWLFCCVFLHNQGQNWFFIFLVAAILDFGLPQILPTFLRGEPRLNFFILI